MMGAIHFKENFKVFRAPGDMKFPKINLEPRVVGVEIGSDWLKIAQKNRVKQGEAVYQAKLLKLAQIKGSVAEAIEESFRSLKLDRQHVVAFIPRHLVTVRILDLPATDPKEISDMIDLQVGKQTPYAKEEIVFAHKVVEAGATGYTKVMLAIVARNIVGERMEALRKAGLTVRRVAVTSEGVSNWFREVYPEDAKRKDSQAVILVDVDSNYSDFIVMRKGQMAFTRNIFIGANHLMQEAAADWREKFSDELKRSLERYQGVDKNVEIVKAYLSGSGPNIKGLETVLGSALGVRAENAVPPKNFHSWGIPGGPQEDLKFVSLTQLLGVTLNDQEPYMDLTPNEQKVQNVMDRKTKQLTVMGILVAAIVTALSFLYLVHAHNKSVYLTELKKTISEMAVEAESIDKMRAIVESVEQRLGSREAVLGCVGEIYRITPTEISLTDIDINEKQTVLLKGEGLRMSDVFKYVKSLEESDLFENVKATYTRMKTDKRGEFAEFEISGIYQK